MMQVSDSPGMVGVGLVGELGHGEFISDSIVECNVTQVDVIGRSTQKDRLDLDKCANVRGKDACLNISG